MECAARTRVFLTNEQQFRRQSLERPQSIMMIFFNYYF